MVWMMRFSDWPLFVGMSLFDIVLVFAMFIISISSRGKSENE